MARVATSYTLRVSGVVALADGSNRQFMKAYDGRFVATNFGSTIGILSVYNKNPNKAQLLALIAEALRTGSAAFVKAQLTSDALDSVNAHISGQVAYNDGSVGGFDVELTTSGEIIDHYDSSSRNSGLGDVSKVASLRSTIKTILSSLFDANVIITPAT